MMLSELNDAMFCDKTRAISVFWFFTFCGIFTFCLAATGTSTPNAKSGPFVSTLIRVEKCKHTQYPYEVVPSGQLILELYNTSRKGNLLRGNYTVYRKTSGLTVSVHDYSLVNGQWEPTFSINRFSCRFYPIATMIRLCNINYDRKTCAVPKGTHVLNNIDFDMFDHVFLSSREYGTSLRVIDILNKKLTLWCFEFEFVVRPKKE